PLGNKVVYPPPPPLRAALEHAGDPLRQNPHQNVIARLTERACHLLIRCPRRQLAGRHALQHPVHRVAEVSSQPVEVAPVGVSVKSSTSSSTAPLLIPLSSKIASLRRRIGAELFSPSAFTSASVKIRSPCSSPTHQATHWIATLPTLSNRLVW